MLASFLSDTFFGRPQISWKALAELCRRVGTSLEAGVDQRRIWTREAQHARGRAARWFEHVRQQVAAGNSAAEALAETDGFVPPIVSQLAKVGEETGHSEQVFLRLAEHFEHFILLRRIFLIGILWPALELSGALLIIGLFILALGMIAQMTGQPIEGVDPRLIGWRGLLLYVCSLIALMAGSVWLYRWTRSNATLANGLARATARIPGLGATLQATALSRMAWTLAMAVDSGMDARRAMRIGIDSTQHPLFLPLAGALDKQIVRGESITEALQSTGAFPRDFLDAVAVGEESGRLGESLQHVSQVYRRKAEFAAKTLTAVATVATWLLVAALLIAMIFFVFTYFYLGQIQRALEPL